ncbi:MAG: hypothetical protein JJW00_07785, partial [Sulfurimonas sp.]|nr:hypothetical protein [Sulfurimonas sp.]
MKKIFAVFFLLVPVLVFAKISFLPFIEAQLEIIKEMDSETITQEEIVELVEKQELLYLKAISNILEDKKLYLESSKKYDTEIFALKKVMSVNKRRGNSLAVARDEVLVKTYEILSEQKKMIKNILIALNNTRSYGEYQKFLNDEFVRNQTRLQEINSVDYNKYLELQSESKVLIQVKENVKIYYMVIEVNFDLVKYLSIFDKKMYSLNEYSRYGLVAPILKINKLQITQDINYFLEPLGLNIIKIFAILLVSIVVYGVKRYVYRWVQNLLFKIKYIQKYSKDIVRNY